MWLVGNQRVLGWWLAVGGQAGWFVWIILAREWGFTPMAFALSITYVRNLVKWRREQAVKCTGLTASWCPIHGDCVCPDGWDGMDDPACPLHAVSSNHAMED
jgi:hypothetical protein